MQDPDSVNSAERGKLLDTPQEDKEMQVVNDRCERFGSPGNKYPYLLPITQSGQTLKSHKRKQQTRTQQFVSVRLSLLLFSSINLNYHLSSPISLSIICHVSLSMCVHARAHAHTRTRTRKSKEQQSRRSTRKREIELAGQGKEEAEVMLPSLAPHAASCTSQPEAG